MKPALNCHNNHHRVCTCIMADYDFEKPMFDEPGIDDDLDLSNPI